jgi:hypothetical protein
MTKCTDAARAFIGPAMTAYYGGRAECRVRRVPVPVWYCDFLSMYPTVNALLGNWELLVAQSIDVADATAEARALLERVVLGDCFEPAQWREFGFFALVEPRGEVLPVRAEYGVAGNSFNIGLNFFTSAGPVWVAGPDLVDAKLLTGRAPNILRAVCLVANGRQPDLRPVRLRGTVAVDPARQDFFRAVIEERKRPRGGADDQLGAFLKVLANSGTYGIFAEVNPEQMPDGKRATVRVHGADAAFEFETSAPEDPGRYCFPPLAALITAGARLMLGLLERCVADAGGTYAFCDTDSMAIVASESGGLIPCPGGAAVTPDGEPAVRALSSVVVRAIVDRFAALNPYDRAIIPGSILEIERVNRNPDGAPNQLYCYAVSAKRYALFNRAPNGGIQIRRGLEHGLGHLMNPTDPDSESRDWVDALWAIIVGEALGLAVEYPPWLDRPAISKCAITTPRQLAVLEKGRKSTGAHSLRPTNFMLAAHLAPLGYPVGARPGEFRLIAPYESDPRRWLSMEWTELNSGAHFRISTSRDPEGRIPQVQSYRTVLDRHRTLPEPKSNGPDGRPCGRATVGLLSRRAVTAREIVLLGKESNHLADIEQGLMPNSDGLVAEFGDFEGEAARFAVLERLRTLPRAELATAVGVTERTIRGVLHGNRRASRELWHRLRRADRGALGK